ncbi:vesicle-associated membrane protein 7B [Cyclospora cayetanensis]|uniref:Vesicle-associated membrane protein 7B n=1 Tax=Cyclospora cayetanensis TaxID=88456 RepID=A0A6P6S3F9_9EIME|nr:vesicle-associated membrane protein 7B [Cyclospora cayetanensis]
MPLIYALVARGNVVLCEHADSEGNFPTVTRLLLCRLPTNKQRMSYIYDRYVFHYIVVDGITFLTMADDSVGFALPFAFLEALKNEFLPQYREAAETGIALSLQGSMESTLKALLDSFNTHQTVDDFRQIRTQIDGIHSVMIDSIDKILQRGERIDLLVDQSEQLNQEAVTFRRQARRLKDAMWWRNVRIIALILGSISILGVILGMISCGGLTFPSCRS